mgnify:CR=1 FL=1
MLDGLTKRKLNYSNLFKPEPIKQNRYVRFLGRSRPSDQSVFLQFYSIIRLVRYGVKPKLLSKVRNGRNWHKLGGKFRSNIREWNQWAYESC